MPPELPYFSMMGKYVAVHATLSMTQSSHLLIPPPFHATLGESLHSLYAFGTV